MDIPNANIFRSQPQPLTAVYWDFENIHASALEKRDGPGAYRQSCVRIQERIVDIEAIMRYVESSGQIGIHRAYGNWSQFARYQPDMLRFGIETIQLFHPGKNAKNGADIALCLDAYADVIRNPSIQNVIIIGGDSDFLPITQRLKALGKRVIGVGVEKCTNRFYANSCHEFKFYETLVPQAVPEPVVEVAPTAPSEREDTALNIRDPRELVRLAITQLAAQHGNPWVNKAAIRPMIKRLDPTFCEAVYGSNSFCDFLKRFEDGYEIRKGLSDHQYRLNDATVVDRNSEASFA